jgi:hypothetical protein
MIKAFINGIMKMMMSLVSILFAPIDALIMNVLPDLSNAFTAIGNLFNYSLQSLGFVVSLTGLSQSTLSLIVMFLTFKLTAPILFSTIKLALKWYDKLKL